MAGSQAKKEQGDNTLRNKNYERRMHIMKLQHIHNRVRVQEKANRITTEKRTKTNKAHSRK